MLRRSVGFQADLRVAIQAVNYLRAKVMGRLPSLCFVFPIGAFTNYLYYLGVPYYYFSIIYPQNPFLIVEALLLFS